MGFPRVDMLRTRTSDKRVFAGTHGRGIFSTNSYNLPPQAAFGVSTLNACAGNIQFVDSTSNAPNTWSWSFGDGGTSTTQHPFHNYAASGTYTVNMWVSSPNGQDSVTQSITINVLPTPVADAGPDSTYCTGDTIVLIGSGGISYQWSPSGAFSDPAIANPTIVVSQTNSYTLTITDLNGCTATDTVLVTASPIPNTWAGSDQFIAFVGDSAQLSGYGGVSYSWTPATGLSCINCQNPKAAPAVTTTYTLTAFNAAGCSRTDNVVVFVNIVSTEPGIDLGISVLMDAFPNPAKDKFTVSLYLPEAGLAEIEMISIDGKQIRSIASGEYPKGKSAFSIQTDNLAKGIYLIRLKAGKTEIVKKMLLN